MNFERSIRGSNREDYEQFSKFLGLGNLGARREEKPNVNIPNSNTCSIKNGKNVAMVYPVNQEWCGIYDPDVALLNGTIFEQLNQPFYNTGCKSNCKEGCL